MLLTKSQLSKASDKDLQQAASAIKTELAHRESTNKAELLKKVKKLAAEAGVSISELLGKATRTPAKSGRPAAGKAARPAAGKARGKVPAKYRNPADASQTWTGRGRQPLWVAQAISSGKSMDALLIK